MKSVSSSCLLSRLLLGELPLGDVAEVRDDGPDGGLLQEVRDPALDPPPRAVLVPEPRIDGERSAGLLEHLAEAAADLLDVLGMNLLEPIEADELVRGIAEDPADGGGDVFDRGVRADEGDDVEAVLDEGLQPLIAVPLEWPGGGPLAAV